MCGSPFTSLAYNVLAVSGQARNVVFRMMAGDCREMGNLRVGVFHVRQKVLPMALLDYLTFSTRSTLPGLPEGTDVCLSKRNRLSSGQLFAVVFYQRLQGLVSTDASPFCAFSLLVCQSNPLVPCRLS